MLFCWLGLILVGRSVERACQAVEGRSHLPPGLVIYKRSESTPGAIRPGSVKFPGIELLSFLTAQEDLSTSYRCKRLDESLSNERAHSSESPQRL